MKNTNRLQGRKHLRLRRHGLSQTVEHVVHCRLCRAWMIASLEATLEQLRKLDRPDGLKLLLKRE